MRIQQRKKKVMRMRRLKRMTHLNLHGNLHLSLLKRRLEQVSTRKHTSSVTNVSFTSLFYG